MKTERGWGRATEIAEGGTGRYGARQRAGGGGVFRPDPSCSFEEFFVTEVTEGARSVTE